MDGVCEDGARGEEVVGGVDVGVGGGEWEEGCHEGAFGGVFGDVGLDWKVGFCGQGAEGVEEGWGAGGCEARG